MTTKTPREALISAVIKSVREHLDEAGPSVDPQEALSHVLLNTGEWSIDILPAPAFDITDVYTIADVIGTPYTEYSHPEDLQTRVLRRLTAIVTASPEWHDIAGGSAQ